MNFGDAVRYEKLWRSEFNKKKSAHWQSYLCRSKRGFLYTFSTFCLVWVQFYVLNLTQTSLSNC